MTDLMTSLERVLPWLVFAYGIVALFRGTIDRRTGQLALGAVLVLAAPVIAWGFPRLLASDFLTSALTSGTRDEGSMAWLAWLAIVVIGATLAGWLRRERRVRRRQRRVQKRGRAALKLTAWEAPMVVLEGGHLGNLQDQAREPL